MTEATNSIFDTYADLYDFPLPLRIEREESGMNNTTRMLYADEERYVLRIYDNHRDRRIVGTEHAILTRLQREGLSIGVPRPVANRGGETITEGADGKLAAVFGYLRGVRPSIANPRHIEGMGQAAGELANALAKIPLDGAVRPAYEPYYSFQATHAAMDARRIAALIAAIPQAEDYSHKATVLLKYVERLTTLIDRIQSLPHQWIHGDIGFTNALAEEDAIVGLLDFEFCTVDVRAMELAVVLADFPDVDESLAFVRVRLFCRGFGSRRDLTATEIGLLPDLMQLRMIDVWLHFAGRLAEGLDSREVWLRETDRAFFVCEWTERRRERLLTLFGEELLEAR